MVRLVHGGKITTKSCGCSHSEECPKITAQTCQSPTQNVTVTRTATRAGTFCSWPSESVVQLVITPAADKDSASWCSYIRTILLAMRLTNAKVPKKESKFRKLKKTIATCNQSSLPAKSYFFLVTSSTYSGYADKRCTLAL